MATVSLVLVHQDCFIIIYIIIYIDSMINACYYIINVN